MAPALHFGSVVAALNLDSQEFERGYTNDTDAIDGERASCMEPHKARFIRRNLNTDTGDVV